MMRKLFLTTVLAFSLSTFSGASASAQDVYVTRGSAAQSTVDGGISPYGTQHTSSRRRAAQQTTPNPALDDFERQRREMEERLQNHENEMARDLPPTIKPPIVLPPVQPEPPPAVRRDVLQKKQVVNGIQGNWLPKKVWENDVDNDQARTLLRKNSK